VSDALGPADAQRSVQHEAFRQPARDAAAKRRRGPSVKKVHDAGCRETNVCQDKRVGPPYMLNIIESVSGQPVSACLGNAISPSRSWLLLRSFFALFISLV
jgi:hypothetical protein